MLLNGINQTYVESKRFTNPLRELLKPATRFGSSERHVAVNFLKARSAVRDSEQLLKLELPEYREWFYSVSEPRRYAFNWDVWDLERAFADPDGYGYNDLLNATIDQMISSNEYDQMNIMVNMFAYADHHMGLHRVNLSAAPTTKDKAMELLQKVRAVAGRMQFPSTLYNQIDIPVFENPDTLVFWCTPETLSMIDVYALSELFNVDRAEVRYRIIVIPEFPIPNVYAALTSEDFIYGREVGYGVEPPFYNPETRTYKYYLWDSEMIGINPCANCALFTTEAATVPATITMTPSGIVFNPDTATAAPGDKLQTHIYLQGSVSGDSAGLIGVEPDAATYSIVGARSTTPLKLNYNTFVDDFGILHIQKSGLADGDTITVTATAAYINPSGSTSTYTDDLVVTIDI